MNISIPWMEVQDYESSSGGTVVWIASHNLCEVQADDYVWAPSPGQRLFVVSRRLVVSSDAADRLDGQHEFWGTRNYGLGKRWFSETYANAWDYRVGADYCNEFSWGTVYTWVYTSPIVLDAGNEIHLTQTGSMSGTRATVSLRCISVGNRGGS